MTFTPSYITKNRLGIHCFQYVIPAIIYRQFLSPNKKLFRKSLKTRERRTALKRARVLWLTMDKLINKFSQEPDSLAKAMKLLSQYDSFAHCDWETVQTEFLDKLDGELDTNLLILVLESREETKKDSLQESIFLTQQKTINFLIEQLKGKVVESKTAIEIEDPKLSTLISKWLLIKKESGIKKSTLTSLTQRIGTFYKIISEVNRDEPKISEISVQIIRKYYELQKLVPSRRNAKYLIGKSFKELSELNLTPISSTSYREYISVITEFLIWVKGDGFPLNNELVGVLKNSVNSNIKKANTIEPQIFSLHDLSLIFTNEIISRKSYLLGKFENPCDYWVPLIGILTGARLGEICQLHISDIRKEEDIWVFNITDTSDDKDNAKSIKTKKSSRLVPVKQELINLGLLEFKNTLLKNGETLLFPDAIRNSEGKFDEISKRFSTKLKSVGVKDNLGVYKRKSFHSFRHTVRTKLSDLNIEGGLIDSIIGHASENRSMGEKRYTHSNRLIQKRNALNKLKFEFDFKLIRKWNECIFGRKMKTNEFIKKNV